MIGEFITVAPALGRRHSISVEASLQLNYLDIVRSLLRLGRQKYGVGKVFLAVETTTKA